MQIVNKNRELLNPNAKRANLYSVRLNNKIGFFVSFSHGNLVTSRSLGLSKIYKKAFSMSQLMTIGCNLNLIRMPTKSFNKTEPGNKQSLSKSVDESLALVSYTLNAQFIFVFSIYLLMWNIINRILRMFI